MINLLIKRYPEKDNTPPKTPLSVVTQGPTRKNFKVNDRVVLVKGTMYKGCKGTVVEVGPEGGRWHFRVSIDNKDITYPVWSVEVEPLLNENIPY